MDKSLIGKKVKLVHNNGFALWGRILDMNEFGVFFKTTQKTSFISFNLIGELTPEE